MLVSIGLVLSPYTTTLNNLAVEIIGALLGVFAAIQLGELIKEIDQTWRAQKLMDEAIKVLNVIEETQTGEGLAAIDIVVWHTLRESAEFSFLSTEDRMTLLSTFQAVSLYNEHCERHFELLQQSNPNMRRLQFLENIAQVAKATMLFLISETLIKLHKH